MKSRRKMCNIPSQGDMVFTDARNDRMPSEVLVVLKIDEEIKKIVSFDSIQRRIVSYDFEDFFLEDDVVIKWKVKNV